MLPSATDLEYFLQVAKAQNISDTARRLGISQPTLTQSIQRLERSVGAPLFLRGRKGVRLTKAGQRIVGQVSTLSELWQSLRKAALEEETELKGSFRIGIHPSVARYTLPGFFTALTKSAPKIEVTLHHDLSRKIAESVINYQVDLGFVINPPRHPELVLKKLTTDTVGVFEARGIRHSEILFVNMELVQTQDILRRLKKTSFHYTQLVECNNLEVIQSLVETGAGYGILPSRVARLNPKSALELVDPKLPTFSDELYAIYRKEVLSSHAGRAILDIASRALAHSGL